MAGKKPTMSEMKNVVSNMLIHMSELENGMRNLDAALSSYIEFNGNRDKWMKWIEDKKKEQKEKQNESKSKQPARSSSKGTKKSK